MSEEEEQEFDRLRAIVGECRREVQKFRDDIFHLSMTDYAKYTIHALVLEADRLTEHLEDVYSDELGGDPFYLIGHSIDDIKAAEEVTSAKNMLEALTAYGSMLDEACDIMRANYRQGQYGNDINGYLWDEDHPMHIIYDKDHNVISKTRMDEEDMQSIESEQKSVSKEEQYDEHVRAYQRKLQEEKCRETAERRKESRKRFDEWVEQYKKEHPASKEEEE